MEGFWPIFFLGVVLKLPVAMALYLVYWAVKAEPELEELPDDGDHGFRRWRAEPRRPRGPRRGPHQPDAHAASRLPARRPPARRAPAGAVRAPTARASASCAEP